MKKHGMLGVKSTLLAALFFGVSASVVASPHDMASWGGEHKEGHGSHKASGHAAGHIASHGKGASSWNKKGKSYDMGGEGFMTARLRAVWTLNLSTDQKSKIRAIQRDLRSKHWALEDKIELASDKLFDLYNAGGRDAKAIGKVYGEIFDYRRQIIEIAIEAGNAAEAELTSDQLNSLKKWRPKHKWGGGWKAK